MDSFSFNKYASLLNFCLFDCSWFWHQKREAPLLIALSADDCVWFIWPNEAMGQHKTCSGEEEISYFVSIDWVECTFNTDLFLYGELLMVHVVKNVPLSVTGADLQGVLLTGWHGEVAGTKASRDDGPGAGQNSGPSDWIPGPHRSPSLQVSQSQNVNVLNFKLVGKGLGCKAMNSVNLFCI